ncbi:MAG: DUF4386 domain-containing protein [Acidobacteria bacterium]|nr:DUF4386 domain-containing protein [Acidobacteriota bacterium]MBU4307254.1 DUF4386 domain-containing protein [Acidobacteriota bacterium]MBU4404959.1 DUF4386 domain-containing protein [Acidobacteriota bacterium]MCG2811056.1 DUF4386 domain-containing protein [Candidatus Aminicenantes bacterium]
MNSNKKTARIAGFWYLLVAVFPVFSVMVVEAKLYVPGNAAATANNILASAGLFRLGFVSSLLGQICFLFLAHALYKLLKSVDKDLARLMVIFIVASVSVTYLNMLNQFASIRLSSGAGYLSAFEPAQLHALAMMFLEMHKYGNSSALIFYGLWLFPLGLLIFRSGFIPKALGVLLILGSLGDLIEFFRIFLFPNVKLTIYPLWLAVAAVAQVSFILWLLVKGVKDQKSAQVEAS